MPKNIGANLLLYDIITARMFYINDDELAKTYEFNKRRLNDVIKCYESLEQSYFNYRVSCSLKRSFLEKLYELKGNIV